MCFLIIAVKLDAVVWSVLEANIYAKVFEAGEGKHLAQGLVLTWLPESWMGGHCL